jgi:hypothetical protein
VLVSRPRPLALGCLPPAVFGHFRFDSTVRLVDVPIRGGPGATPIVLARVMLPSHTHTRDGPGHRWFGLQFGAPSNFRLPVVELTSFTSHSRRARGTPPRALLCNAYSTRAHIHTLSAMRMPSHSVGGGSRPTDSLHLKVEPVTSAAAGTAPSPVSSRKSITSYRLNDLLIYPCRSLLYFPIRVFFVLGMFYA